jgi:hypothetical protein
MTGLRTLVATEARLDGNDRAAVVAAAYERGPLKPGDR